MRQGELELYSTQELLDEVMRRATFQGVVIHAENEARNRKRRGESVFKVRFNDNFDLEEVSRLLSLVAAHLEFPAE